LYVITFYSFKGGVGRTLALVNVGARLAQMGRKVLLVDFDLEAPGLETFERLRPSEPHPGLVEYVTEYVHTKRSPDVREYIYSPTLGRKIAGQLWVMPAGRRDANYEAALTRIDWKKLYDEEEGFLFFEDTKAQWEQEFKPDYVLIDSRTGHTDVKGICTRQLPDAVVVMFFPNDQNLVGLNAVCQEIRSEREHGLKKTIGLHFVMSNVPDLDDEDKVLECRLKAFKEDLGIRRLSAVIHRYESVKLFNQSIFVLEQRKSRLAKEYRNLTRALVRHNPGDREGVLRSLRRWNHDFGSNYERNFWDEDAGMSDQGLLAGEELLSKILDQHRDDADLIYKVARFEPDDALGLLDRVLTLKPDHLGALLERARLRRRMGDAPGAAADLFQYLRSHGLESSEGWTALQNLREAAPDRLLEAVDCAVARGIATENKYKLARFLAETDAGLPRAIELMRDYLADASNTEPKANAAFFLQSYLIRSRRWGEVIASYESAAHAGDKALSWLELFNVGMAHWAQSGTVPGAVSGEIRQRLEEKDAELWGALLGEHEPWVCKLEAESWLAWWLGHKELAPRFLEIWLKPIDEWIKEQRMIHQSWWSFWGYRGVQLSQYRDDLEQLRRLIQGGPVRPAFMGDSASPA
jgi:MinD-like ATPase involved in chromosome partitioning or flagellar assembly